MDIYDLAMRSSICLPFSQPQKKKKKIEKKKKREDILAMKA